MLQSLTDKALTDKMQFLYVTDVTIVIKNYYYYSFINGLVSFNTKKKRGKKE